MPDASASAAPRPFEKFGHGIGAAFLAPVAVAILGAAFAGTQKDEGGYLMVAVGLGFVSITQLAWVLPLALWADHTRRTEFYKGLWTGAGIIALLQATCFGIAFLKSK